MVIASKTDDEVLQELGARLRAYRLQMNLSQEALAVRAGVNRTTIRDAELGKDFQLTTLVKLLRALGRLGDLDAFLPAPSVSPIQLMKRRGKPRRRARKSADG
jgi:transcriptional regulator with XRE-family HTH domain